MRTAPTIRPETQQEHHKAKWWRLHVARLTPEQLAERTGYAPRTIYLMELGCTADGKKIKPWVWTRYKRACAGTQLPGFDWGQ